MGIKTIEYKLIDTDKVEEIIYDKIIHSKKEKANKIKELEKQRDEIVFIEIPKEIIIGKKDKPNEEIILVEDSIVELINQANLEKELFKSEIENQIKLETELLSKLKLAK